MPRLLLDPALADDYGLVAVGGDLRPETLIGAYRHGVFPWYDETTPILWWSPDPRGIIEIDGLHISRRLARTLRSGIFQFSVNCDFAAVILACGDRPGQGTWLTAEMLEAYEELHRLGIAHSVEAWHGDTLAGGVYGVAIGGLFAAESMFTRVRDGSKVALAFLMARLKERGFTLCDIQMLSPHTASLGAIEISREEYLERLREAIDLPATFASEEDLNHG
jgi:leucyl/phenylalanyl-tRNA--protein transferase